MSTVSEPTAVRPRPAPRLMLPPVPPAPSARARTWSQLSWLLGLALLTASLVGASHVLQSRQTESPPQAKPSAEVKLIRCTRGAIYDVIVDLRVESPTHCDWLAVELTESNRRMLYVPDGLAHGFQTLADGTEVSYQMSQVYVPDATRGVRWDDPAFDIEWPEADRLISEKDRRYPDYHR